MRAEPTDAESYEAVIEVLRGRRIALDAGASKMLRILLGDATGCDAVITPRELAVRLGPGPRLHRYVMQVAPGVVSFLLDGTELPATRVLTRRLGPGAIPAIPGRSPVWRFDARHVRIEALIGRTVIRIRASEAELDASLPDTVPESAMRFAPAARPCPHCAGTPERFRVLSDGAYVCMPCGRSFRGP